MSVLAPGTFDMGSEASDRASDRCGIVAASAADLVSEHAAEQAADDRAADVGAAAILDDFLFHPAALFRRADHRAH